MIWHVSQKVVKCYIMPLPRFSYIYGIPEKRVPGPRTQDPGPYEDPGPYDDPVLYDDPGPNGDQGLYEDPMKTQDPMKTKDLRRTQDQGP